MTDKKKKKWYSVPVHAGNTSKGRWERKVFTNQYPHILVPWNPQDNWMWPLGVHESINSPVDPTLLLFLSTFLHSHSNQLAKAVCWPEDIKSGMHRIKWGSGNHWRKRVGCNLSPHSKHGHALAEMSFVLPALSSSTLYPWMAVTRGGIKNSHPGARKPPVQRAPQC